MLPPPKLHATSPAVGIAPFTIVYICSQITARGRFLLRTDICKRLGKHGVLWSSDGFSEAMRILCTEMKGEVCGECSLIHTSVMMIQKREFLVAHRTERRSMYLRMKSWYSRRYVVRRAM